MKTSTKIAIGVVVLVIVAFFVGRLSVVNRSLVGAVSPAGTTNLTPRVASIVFQPLTAGATSTSVYNGDVNDRIISSVDEGCTTISDSRTPFTGASEVVLAITAATTSANAPQAALSSLNTNYVLDATNLIATTTPAIYFLASSTPGYTATVGGMDRIWLAGSYLTFSANATNTMSCVMRVGYLPE